MNEYTFMPDIISDFDRNALGLLYCFIEMIDSKWGIPLIISGLFAWYGKIQIERFKAGYQKDIERYKIKLKKSEMFFEKELKAAYDLSEFKESLLGPPGYSDESFDDALISMAYSSGAQVQWLRNFIKSHAFVLPEEIKKYLYVAMSIAGESEIAIESADPENVTNDIRTKAQNFWDLINEANNCYLEYIRTQAGVEKSSFPAD